MQPNDPGTAASPFAELVQAAFGELPSPRPVRVSWDGQRLAVTLRVEAGWPEDKARQLAQAVGEVLGAPVSLAWEVAVGEDAAGRVMALLRAETPALASLLEGRVAVQAGSLVVRFPNPVAASLFEKWGGFGRLARCLPGLPPWEAVVEEPPPAQPPPVLALPADDGRWRLGRGEAAAAEGDPLDRLMQAKGGARASVTARGQVFRADPRRGEVLIADGRGALRVRLPGGRRRRGEAEEAPLPPVGSWICVQGRLESDPDGEPALVARDGCEVAAPSPLPDPWPRVELHCHTKMSAMDGLVDVDRLFARAKALGHQAVAIVDHGVAQAFPEADEASRRHGVRALYGIEAYVVEAAVAPLSYPSGAAPVAPDTPWVVVDLETTGLSPRIHEAIEIGAVRIEGGEVRAHFHRLLQPARAVSRASQAISGITAVELAEAGIEARQAWEEFFDFCGERAVLVAHNAAFDVGFIRRAWRQRTSAPFPYPVLDTVALARAVMPGLRSYGLGALADAFKVALTRHHRALADAEATAAIFLRLLAQGAGDEAWPTALAKALPVAPEVQRPWPVVLLATGQEGLHALYRAITRSHLQTFHRVPRLLRPEVAALRQAGHVLVGCPALGGEAVDLLLRGADEEELARALAFYDYLEVVPPDALAALEADEHLGSRKAVEELLDAVIAWGRRQGLPVVAVSDAHYLDPCDAVLREILAETAKGELHDAGAALHYRSARELWEAFAWLTEEERRRLIVEDPAALAARIGDMRPVPDTLASPTLPEAVEVVSNESRRRARELYGDPLPELVAARLEREIRAIVDHGFASIYYIAHRLVRKSLEDGYLVGSRGSVGSSLVAFLLDITEVNPLPPHRRCPGCRRTDFVLDGTVGSGFDLAAIPCPDCGQAMVGDGHDIPFETFLGFEGDKVPDIDLNFSGEYQAEIHRYTEELFGRGHVFRAGTIATVAERTAFGLVKAWARNRGIEPTAAWTEWLAQGLTGVKRTTGQHPGGLMVVPKEEDIHHFTPVQHPADDRDAEVITTHFDYHAISSRLLKLDLLGHDDPTVIRMLEDLTGVPVGAVPFRDEETMAIFSGQGRDARVGVVGVPEFGTRFVRGMLADTRPRTFAELIRISGLSHGTEVWTNNAQDLIRQGVAGLSEVIATRDDIMLYLIARGMPPKEAFAISESVRKGKGISPAQQEAMRRAGVPEWYLNSCRKISYLFPKAHAAAYVMMGWRIAWFKVHHPLAFYAATFSVRSANFDPQAAVAGASALRAAMRELEEKGPAATAKDKNALTDLEIALEMVERGYRFFPVDLERSDATRYTIVDNEGLRIPFVALPGLGAAQAQAIVAARAERPFLSVDDLRQRAHLSRATIDLLRRYGALNHLGENNQLVFL